MTQLGERACPRCGGTLRMGGCATCSAHATALPSLPELPPLDTDTDAGLPGLLTPELSATAASLASAWRGAPQTIYGRKPADLDRLIKAVLSDATASSQPQPQPSWDREALAARAGFGDVPSGRVAAIAYAYRVMRRKRELHAEIAQAERAASEARITGRDALIALGEAIFARRAEAGRGSLAPRVEQTVKALASVDERKRVQSAQSVEAGAELAEHDVAIAAAEHAAEPFRARVSSAEQKVARVRRDKDRAAAMHKRASIEIRAAQSAAQPDAARIERAQADEQVRKAELVAAENVLAKAEAELATATAELSEKMQGVAALRSERQAAADAQAQKAAQAQAGLDEALRAARAMLGELASKALLDNLAPKAQAEAAIAALDQAQAAAEQAALTAAAPKAYDEEAYRSGLMTAVVAAVVSLGLLAWLAV